MGAEESGWSERRTRALFKYIFRIEWAQSASSGFLVTLRKPGGSRSNKMTKSNCRVVGQWVRSAWVEQCVVQRADGARLAENWLADPQKQRPNPPETAAR
jgi:hypothetical protein